VGLLAQLLQRLIQALELLLVQDQLHRCHLDGSPGLRRGTERIRPKALGPCKKRDHTTVGGATPRGRTAGSARRRAPGKSVKMPATPRRTRSAAVSGVFTV